MLLPNFAKYQTTEEIYRRMGTIVYRAVEPASGKPVVLKVFDKEFPSKEEVARLQHELRIIQKLEGKGTPKCLELVEDNHRFSLVFEETGHFRSLTDILKDGPLPLLTTLKIAIQFCDILARVHSHGILHKDIKTANIVFEEATGTLQILDFGIATELQTEKKEATAAEALEGTLAYMSPEQTGRMNRSVDYRSDYYSFGVTLYELFTSDLPFHSDDPMGMVHCHVAKTPATPHEKNPAVPSVISKIILKLMEKSADDRYQGLGGVKADLTNCLNQLKKSQHISDFEIGQHDVTSRFQIPQKLYGRENDIQIILNTYKHISDGQSEILLVSGFSGIGKSSIIHEIHRPIVESRGFFVSGKYDQYTKRAPYSAFSIAFQDLLRQLLLKTDDDLNAWKMDLQTALDINGEVLTDIIPELTSFIGPQTPVTQLPAAEAQVRLNETFLKFIKVFTKRAHPLVLFIDDLQWADIPSLDLIRTIMLEEDQKYLMLIGSYRDNEVDPTHPLMITLDKIKQFKKIHQLTLNPFTKENVTHLLCDTFKKAEPQVTDLADLLMTKTQGNPFFVCQSLQSLYQEQLIQFSHQDNQWVWELDRIHSMGITSNVVELMIRQVQKQPEGTQMCLQLAACMGNIFSVNALAIVSKLSLSKTGSELWPAIEAGLLIPIGETAHILRDIRDDDSAGVSIQVKFLHDRVQQAAYSFIDQSQRDKTHLEIGRLLLKSTPEAHLEERLFEIIPHLNAGRNLIDDDQERATLVELNLTAARKSKLAVAYSSYLEFMSVAMNLIPADAWKVSFDRTQGIYLELAEATFLNHRFDELTPLLDLLQESVNDLHTEVKISSIRMRAFMAQTKPAEITFEGFRILGKLGFKLRDPRTVKDIHIILAVLASKLRMINSKAEQIINRPVMTDLKCKAAMDIIAEIGPAAAVAFPKAFPIVLIKHAMLSFMYGNHPYSGTAYGTYAVVIARIGQLRLSRKFQEVAFSIQDKFGTAQTRSYAWAPTSFFLLWQWHPFAEAIRVEREAYTAAFATGNYNQMAICIFGPVMMDFCGGGKLPDLIVEVVNTRRTIMRINQYTFLELSDSCFQCIQTLGEHLEDSSHTPAGLSGHIFDESVLIPKMEHDNNTMGLFLAHCFSTYLSSFFDMAETTLQKAARAERYIDEAPIMAIHPGFYTVQCLALAEKYPTISTRKEKRKAVAKIKKNLSILKMWAESAPMNFRQKYFLAEAALAVCQRNANRAAHFFEKAIHEARENQILGDAAIACERYGKYCLASNENEKATKLLVQAHFYYGQWGALAKVDHLEACYPQLFSKESRPDQSIVDVHDTSRRTESRNGSSLDIDAVMRVSQVISGEIQLEMLLKKMMVILAESAGAQRGAILLKDDKSSDDNWLIQASLLEDGEVKLLSAIPLSESQELATSIVRYVSRSSTPVILGDASISPEYQQDASIVQRRPKSVLCLPIINQGKTVGILYLENNAVAHAFTQKRFELLKVICSQIAVSIENALLYNSLEEKVLLRTKQLRESQSKLTQSYDALERASMSIRAILENILYGVFTFGEDYKIEKEYSRHLHAILERSDLEGRDFLELVFVDSNLSSDQLNQMTSILAACLGGSMFDYQINGSQLPGEITRRSGAQILQLDWVPMENQEGVIAKMMVTLRDITELRGAELKAKAHARELDMIGQLLAIEPPRLESILKQSYQDLGDALELLTVSGERKLKLSDDEWTRENCERSSVLFRYLHTLKGNSRTYKLLEVTSLVHDTEQFYSKYMQSPSAHIWDHEALALQIVDIRSILEEYENLNRSKLSVRLGNDRAVWLEVKNSLSSDGIEGVKKLIQQKSSVTFSYLIQPLIKNLSESAKMLGKDVPHVKIEGPVILVNHELSAKLEGIFAHILNNSVDHGIPSHSGEIIIETNLSNKGECLMRVRDNGRGLNLYGLKEKWIASGRSSLSSSDEETAELIFQSGFSTTEKVTEISGRGVGMDAVRAFVEQLGGEIAIEFSGPRTPNGFRTFSLVLSFPSEVATAQV